jgi:nucleoid-associated protein YgaU|tara:strand:+ start:105 stop:449 length:345 start_codon:yes stop_codon:yes gene_type:complete
MAKSRYKKRQRFNNDLNRDADLRESRSTKTLEHYLTPKMRYPSSQLRAQLTKTVHVWSSGDRYWKLAARYYKDPSLWWVIAWYNLKPTDGHCNIGDNIIIPGPIGKILKYYSVT